MNNLDDSNIFKIDLPKKLNFSSFDYVLEDMMKILNNDYKEVEFDFSNVHFVEPRGVTLLTNLMSWLQSNQIHYSFIHNERENNNNENDKAMLYLRDIGFFSLNNISEFYGNPRKRSTVLPINKIKSNNVNQWNDTEFLKFMRDQTNSSAEFSHLRVAVEEIFNNISDHSTKKIGCCSGQYYPKNKEIRISFSDFGIGIPRSLKNNWKTISTKNDLTLNINKLNDSELLEIAVKEGISAKSKPGNRGAGLTNIIRSLTNAEIGKVYIRSNYGQVWFKNKEIYNKMESNYFYPGTFYDIILDTDNVNLFDEDIKEEFEW